MISKEWSIYLDRVYSSGFDWENMCSESNVFEGVMKDEKKIVN